MEKTGEDKPEFVKFDSGAVRGSDCADLRYDLIPRKAMRRLAGVFAAGAKKYGVGNWEKGIPISDCHNHAVEHILKYLDGDRSEDHHAHAAANLFMAMHFDNGGEGALRDETNAIGIEGDTFEVPRTEAAEFRERLASLHYSTATGWQALPPSAIADLCDVYTEIQRIADAAGIHSEMLVHHLRACAAPTVRDVAADKAAVLGELHDVIAGRTSLAEILERTEKPPRGAVGTCEPSLLTGVAQPNVVRERLEGAVERDIRATASMGLLP